MREGLPYAINVVIAVFAQATFAYGYTPAEFLELISPAKLVLILLLLVVASLIYGAFLTAERKNCS